MSNWLIAIRGLFHNKRINLAVALGVAVATAVLTGALIVGDSMRGSLRSLTLDRLGKIDLILTSPGFFSESLQLNQRDKENQSDIIKVPVIHFPNGSAETAGENQRRASNVTVVGVRKNFWWLYSESRSASSNLDRELERDEIVLNQTLAEDLGITEVGQQVTIGIPEQQLLPADSALGEKEDIFERIVGLKVAAIIPAEGAGRFGLHPTQLPPRNAYVSIELLQSVLSADILKFKPDQQQANMLLISSTRKDAIDVIQKEMSPTLSDLGLRAKRVTQYRDADQQDAVFDYVALSSDRMVIDNPTRDSLVQAFPDARPVMVYMSNDLRPAGSSEPGVPFSIVASVEFDSQFDPRSATTDEPARRLELNEIALTDWVADDLGVKVGDQVQMSYFEPESSHGESEERTIELLVAEIVALTTPSTKFQVTRRGQITPPIFDSPPTMANDPDFTPVVPGLTDAASIENWELPFETSDKIRSQDEEYWDYHRTTPKAFVSLETGQALWASRFGDTTSFRIPTELSPAEIEKIVVQQLKTDEHMGGLQVIPIKQNGLQASAGSTPFDVLFLMLSMFVIAAALILVSLLFRLGIEQRSNEIGLLLANGYSQKKVTRIWLTESSGVALVGSILGAILGVGYAGLILYALKTWWVGAITTPFLQLHISWWVIPAGILLGTMVSLGTIYWAIRQSRGQPVRGLLAGRWETRAPGKFRSRLMMGLVVFAIVCAIGTSIAATMLAGETQAIAFMFVGFLVLVVLLILVWQQFARPSSANQVSSTSLGALANSNARRNPLRSTLTIGLVAVAAFLILAISSFRQQPTEAGTAGFDYVGQTSQPVFTDFSTEAGREELFGNQSLSADTSVLPLRFKSGEDASCNNLYQSTQPRVLGVTPEFVDYFDQTDQSFAWYASVGKGEAAKKNPWHVLNEPVDGGAVPVVIDKNTAWYSLKIYLPGQTFDIEFATGEKVTFILVGLLDHTLLQGSLLVSEKHFEERFTDISGYRYFLVKTNQDAGDQIDKLANALGDQGFEARSADKMLAGFLAVQNTYLTTFQSLGALGLLLGTFGLMAVQLRNVFERRRELAVMRAVGYSRNRLAGMVLRENMMLLTLGLGIGILAALVATLPHLFLNRATLPWRELLAVFAVILVVGLITSWLASRRIQQTDLIQSLRV